MNKKIWTPLLLLSSVLAFTACDDDDDDGLSGQAPNASQLGGSTISFNPTFEIFDDATQVRILDLSSQADFIDNVERSDIPGDFVASVDAVNDDEFDQTEVTFGLPPLPVLNNAEADLRVVLKNFEPGQENAGDRQFTLDWFLELDGDVIAERTDISSSLETPEAVADNENAVISPEPEDLVEILTDGNSFDPGTDVIDIVDNFGLSGNELGAQVNLTQAGTDILIDPSGNTPPATAPGVVTYEKTGVSTGLLTVTVDDIGVEVTANLLFNSGTSGNWNGSLTQDAANTVGNNQGEELNVPIENEPFEVIVN